METTLDRLVGLPIAEARCDRTFPAGTIGVVSADLARYADFSVALAGVKYPYGSTMIWQRGCDLTNNFNRLAREMDGDWLWIMGDDHFFDSNILFRLLDRMYGSGQCDLVAPLCLGRQAPFPTVMGMVDEAAKTVRPVFIHDCVDKGLLPVDVVGSAGLLVRKRVFETLVDPWFEAGCLTRTGLGEDWYFCWKARRAGFQTWVDTTVPLGHITQMTVWPHLANGTSGARIELGEPRHSIVVQHVMEGA